MTEYRAGNYRLPDGTIVACDPTATKGAPVIDFTLKGGKIVKAHLVTEPHVFGPHPDPEKAAKGWLQCSCGSAPGTSRGTDGALVCVNTPGLVTYSTPNGTEPLPTMLDGLAEVDEAWMAQFSMLRCYAPRATGVVRVESLPGREKRFGGHMLQCFHAHDGTGVLMDLDYHSKRVRWYRYGCAHNYKPLSSEECRVLGIQGPARCYHVSKCTLCDHVSAVDTSD